MNRIKDIITGIVVLNIGGLLIGLLVLLAMALVYAWIFPIVAACVWSWWWLLAEVPIVALYVWIWHLSESNPVMNGEQEHEDNR